MAIDSETNNGIYFVLGALVVAVATLGFIYISVDEDLSVVEPSWGYTRPATTPNTVDNTDTDSSTEFDTRVDNEGVSGSAMQRND